MFNFNTANFDNYKKIMNLVCIFVIYNCIFAGASVIKFKCIIYKLQVKTAYIFLLINGAKKCVYYKYSSLPFKFGQLVFVWMVSLLIKMVYTLF